MADGVKDLAGDVKNEIEDHAGTIVKGAGSIVKKYWLDSIFGALESMHARTDAYTTHVHVST